MQNADSVRNSAHIVKNDKPAWGSERPRSRRDLKAFNGPI